MDVEKWLTSRKIKIILGKVLPIKSIEEVYQKTEDPNFNFQIFIQRNSRLLQDNLLTEKELKRFMDLYMRPRICLTGCQACMQPVDDKEDTFELPVCGHVVHKACMLEIVAIGINCPACKRNIRVCMLQEKLTDENTPGRTNSSFDHYDGYSLVED